MSEPTHKAVFLSYASQDAEAAKRIADALRAAGVEVWFDAEGGLEHGDEWDAKIRRQIKECVLFLPIISANTQAREEGYFRIEWELAAQRALGIASGVAFILPIVIDDTREPDALVPDRFRSVQWTRLRGGELTPEVKARFLKLWSHRTGVLKHGGEEQGARSGEREAGRPRPAERGTGAAPPKKIYILMFAAVLAVVAVLGWWFMRAPAARPMPVAATTPPALSQPALSQPAVSQSNPSNDLSDARRLAQRAQALIESLDGSRDDYQLAQEMVIQAKAKDATDAEVCAIEAHIHESYIQRGWDTSDTRRESARTAVQRAIRLDPASFEARFAQARLLGLTGREGEERERQLRELRKERPADQRILRALATVIDRLGRIDESAAIARESAALPGGDPLALYSLSQGYWFAGRAHDAEGAIEAAIAQKPFTGALLMSAWYKTSLRGDIAQARQFIERVDPGLMQEDRAAYFAYYTELLGHNPNQAIRWLQAVPRDWLNDSWYRGPKALLVGDAHAFAGRLDAASLEWQSALKLTEQRLVDRPKDPPLLRARVQLLAKLGQRDEAARQLSVLLQIVGVDSERATIVPPPITDCFIALGRKAEALRQMASFVKNGPNWAVSYPSAILRLDPIYDALRAEPEFTALLAEVEARERAIAAPAPASKSDPPATAPSKVGEKSVAVLAFANLSDDKDNEYFSDGISEELLTVLQKIPGLHVAARTSAFSFKGKSATAQEIGEKLGVATLVEGSVRKAGHQVRITARLSRAATGEQLWSESYTRDVKDVFAVQSELAETIVGQLRNQLGGAVTKAEIQAQVSAAEIGGTRNVEAHELHLQGRYLLNQLGPENLVQAADRLQRAVALDPAFALAWAELVNVETLRIGFASDRAQAETSLVLARRAADRALALAPDLAAAHLARWRIQATCEFDWKGASESIRRALLLAPADADVILAAAFQAYFFGRLDQALELSRQALVLDPVNPLVHQIRARMFEALRRFDESLAENRSYTELSPTNAWAHTGIGRIYVDQGRFAEAVAEAEQGPVEWARVFVLAEARWGQKKTAESDAALARLIQGSGDVAAIQIAQVYTFRRENDHAFEWLEGALAQRDPGMCFSKADLTLGALHADPRWEAFMHKLGLADDQLK